jgi:anti-sigma factor RsiW
METITCQGARSLISSYLDGEVSEVQAAPLRGHLLSCFACREIAKEGTALSRWFHPLAEEDRLAGRAPAGFAARVARRALAGDPGLLIPQRTGAPSDRRHLSFVLWLCAAAAAVLFVLAIALQRGTLPRGDQLEASPIAPWERGERTDTGARVEPAGFSATPPEPVRFRSERRKSGAPAVPEDPTEQETQQR